MPRFAWAALAAALVLARTSEGRAGDTVLLGGTGEATVQSLLFDGQADTQAVYWRGWGHRPYAGSYRPYYRPYFYRPYAYRPYYGYRPYFAYRPFYGYWPYYAYRPFAYGYAYDYGYSPSYYAPSYYAPSYYYSPPYYRNPCSTDLPAMPNTVVLGSSSYGHSPIHQTPSNAPFPRPRQLLPPPQGDGTYLYDGGPNQPMPLPARDGPAPTFQEKRPTVPLDGKLVSIPARPASYSYPAYGESIPASPRAASFSVVSNSATRTVQVAYPAYGDR